MKRRTAIAALALGRARTGWADDALERVLAGAHRTPANVARDVWRHPRETLEFFGLRPDMTVVEIKPGGGWYTEILAPYLRERGRLILAGDDPASTSTYTRRSAEGLLRKLRAEPGVYDRVGVTVFDPPRRMRLAAPGSVDLALTFRNVHNWATQGDGVVRVVFERVFECLKPGGVLGVVDHRLPAGRVGYRLGAGGYMLQARVIRLAESVGLTLAAASEINANPGDSADHEGGVWALPPSFAHQDRNRAHYAAIGESDRMTLKFVKG